MPTPLPVTIRHTANATGGYVHVEVLCPQCTIRHKWDRWFRRVSQRRRYIRHLRAAAATGNFTALQAAMQGASHRAAGMVL